MAKQTKKPSRSKEATKTADADRVRLKRFLYLWLPIICLVLIAFYASALDPSKPTGRTTGASLIGKNTYGGAQSTSTIYRIRLDNGEETEVFIPETRVPPAGSRIVVEEYATYLLKKKTYQYLRTVSNQPPSK